MSPKIVISCFALLVFCSLVNANETDDLLGLITKRAAPCTISLQCTGKYDICYEHKCRSKVPCNKDNDCFFYAAGDVANGSPHPKCYKIKGDTRVPIDYGYCMLKERVGTDSNLLRLKGLDVDSLDEHPIDTSKMH